MSATRKFQSSENLCCVVGVIVPDIQKNRHAFIFRVTQFKRHDVTSQQTRIYSSTVAKTSGDASVTCSGMHQRATVLTSAAKWQVMWQFRMRQTGGLRWQQRGEMLVAEEKHVSHRVRDNRLDVDGVCSAKRYKIVWRRETVFVDSNVLRLRNTSISASGTTE